MADATITINVKTNPADPLDKLVQQTKAAEKEAESLSSSFLKVGAAIGGLAVLKGTFDFVLNATRQMEDLTTQFISFTGSAEGAAAQLAVLSDFAAESPFELSEIADANRTLLAFGSSTKQSVEQLRQLAEVSAATGKDLGDLATIFGQIQAEGKLTGERFNQLIERGVNIGPELAKSLGVAGTAIRGLISDSKISSEEVAKAFQKMTSEGGQFFGATERLSKTVSGSLSTLSDNFTALGAAIGGSATPAFAGFISVISQSVDGLTLLVNDLRGISKETEAAKRIKEIGVEVENLTKQRKKLEEELAGGMNFFGDDKLTVLADLDIVKTKLQAIQLERLKLAKSEGLAESAKKDKEAADELAATQTKANEKKQEELRIQREAEQAELDKANAAKIAKAQETEKQISTLIQQEAAVRALIEQEQTTANDELKLATLMERESQITTARVEAEAQRAEQLGQLSEAEIARNDDKQRRLTDATKKGEQDRLNAVKKAKEDEFNFVKAKTDAEIAFDQQTYTQRVQTAQKGLSALASLQKSGVREAFTLGKRAAQAQVILDIPKAAFAAYNSLIGIPFAGPFLAAGAAASAVLYGQQQLRQIEAAQFAEGGVVPGIGNKDTVPALLTPGEVVVPKQNFEDLKSGIGGNADEIALLQQGNQISARILDQLTFGVVNEKLTTMVALLNEIKLNTVFRPSEVGPIDIGEIINEGARNSPIGGRPGSGSGLGGASSGQQPVNTVSDQLRRKVGVQGGAT
jgi:tape measure domain-containing protein